MTSSPCDGWVDWQGSKCQSKCFAAFLLRTKSLTLICIYGDCNATIGFITLMARAFRAVTSQSSSLIIRCVVSCIQTLYICDTSVYISENKSRLLFFEIRLLVESSVVYQAKTNDLFQYQTMRTTELFDIFFQNPLRESIM